MANPNPSPETRFTSSGNPAGKTAKQRQDEVKASEIAASLRLRALIRMQERLDNGEIEADEIVNSDALRLFKDSEDRAHGTPRQSVEHSGSVDHRHSARNMTDDELAAYLRDDTDQS